MKKKICFIAQFPPPIHGLSKAVETLYESNLKNEFDFQKIDITNNKKFIKNIISIFKSNADLYYFTISQTKGGNLRDLMILKLLEKQHKKCLIHLHGGYYRELVEKKLPKWQKKANYNVIKKLDGVIVLGNSLKHIFRGMIDKDKIFVVPNCIDDEFLLKKEEIEEKIEYIENKKIKEVLYLSNFIKEKGYEYVLQLAKLEKEKYDMTGNRKFHFNFAGKFFDKENEKEFFDYINKNNLDNFVTYHGIVKGNKKKQLLKYSDIFILLTTYPKEGQPISILEAMGNGMVIVTTNHAGIPDIVENNRNGVVINKNEIDIENNYKKLEKIDFKKVIENNYEDVQKYNQDNYLQNMEKQFNGIIEKISTEVKFNDKK